MLPTPQDRDAAAVLLLMGKLYAIEKEARGAGATERFYLLTNGSLANDDARTCITLRSEA